MMWTILSSTELTELAGCVFAASSTHTLSETHSCLWRSLTLRWLTPLRDLLGRPHPSIWISSHSGLCEQ